MTLFLLATNLKNCYHKHLEFLRQDRSVEVLERMPGKPEAIGGILAEALKGLGLQRYFDGWRVVSEWPAIVGEVTARKAEAVRFDDGVLVVTVADDSWRQQLSMQREEILALIKRQPYGRAVEKIRFERGEKGRRP